VGWHQGVYMSQEYLASSGNISSLQGFMEKKFVSLKMF
jgi:hypothetical protein